MVLSNTTAMISAEEFPVDESYAEGFYSEDLYTEPEQMYYDLSFDANGGTGIMDPVPVAEGEIFLLPQCGFAPPACQTFAGWQIGEYLYQPGNEYVLYGYETAVAQWAEDPAAHQWAVSTWNWAEDGSYAEAVISCAVCGSQITVPAGISVEEFEDRYVYTASAVYGEVSWSDTREILKPAAEPAEGNEAAEEPAPAEEQADNAETASEEDQYQETETDEVSLSMKTYNAGTTDGTDDENEEETLVRGIESTDVAKIGEEGYATLQAAFDAAGDGDTITLLGNVDATASMYSGDARYNLWINKSVTVDGGENTLTVTGNGIGIQSEGAINVAFENIVIVNADHGRCVDVSGPVTMSITNSTINGLWPLYFSTGSSGSGVAIDRSTLKSTADANDKNLGVVYFNDGNINVIANDSTFDYTTVSDEWHALANDLGFYSGILFRLEKGNVVKMNGNYAFIGINFPKKIGSKLLLGKDTVFYGNFVYQNNYDDINACAEEGYEIKDKGDGTYTFGLAPVHYYWSDGEGGYEGVGCSFNEPFDNGWLADGEYIELQENVTLDKNLSANVSFNLFLGEHTITSGEYKISLAAGKTVTSDTAGLASLFSAPEGCNIVEAVSGDSYTYTVEENKVAQIGDVTYKSLADAIAAVPADGTETVITMLADEAIVAGVMVAAGQNIVLELDGHTVSGNTDSTTTYALITNKGMLTIQDGTDINKNGTGTGLITTYITNPDGGNVPGYASNTITNNGSLTVKSGKIVNNGNGYACYAIDNQTNGTAYSPILNIEGGRMEQMNAYTYAVRMFCNSTTNVNTVNVTGGVITGGYGLWLQTPNANANMADLNISGGTILANDGAALYIGGTKADNSKISISVSGGTIGGTGAIVQGPLSGTYGHVEITGGKIENVQCGVNVENFISGGIFNQSVKEEYIAPGYKAIENSDGTYSVVEKPDVAQIGENKYKSLADAIAAVPTDGTETVITMLADEEIDVTGYALTISAGKNVVLDLNGKSVSGICTTGKTSAVICNLGTLTINDSVGGGELSFSPDPTWVYSEADPGGYASNLIRNEGTLVVNSGTLYNAGTGSATYTIDNYNAGKVMINGGTVDAKKASAIRMFYNNGGSVTVNGGTVGHYTSDDDCSFMGIQVMNGTNADVNISGGTIAGDYAFYSSGTGDSAVSISGGTFDGYVGFGSAGPDTISITGGNFMEWVGTWGDQTGFLSGGFYTTIPDDAYVATEKEVVISGDDFYLYMIGTAVASVDGLGYATFDGAVAAAGGDKVITLLADITDEYVLGSGILKVNLNGKTLTVKAPENRAIKKSTEGDITTYTVVDPVAKVGDALYASLQDAIDAAHELTGEVTVTLLEDVTEVAVVHQKAGLNLTINGDAKTITGQIYIDGDGRYEGTDTLTITNTKFAYDAATYDDAFVNVPSTRTAGKPYTTGKYNYAHNITVSGCEFAGSDTTTVAFRVASGAGANKVTLQDLEVTGGHSLAQLVGVKDLRVTSCSATGVKNGINISGGDGTGVIAGNTLTADGYTVRVKDASGMAVTLKENVFSGAEGLVNEATAGGKFTVESGKYAGPLPIDAAKLTVTGGLFTVVPMQEVCGKDAAGDQLYPMASGDPDYPYTVGKTVVAKIGSVYYTSLQAAVRAAIDGDTVILLTDTTESFFVDDTEKTITIDLGGKTMKGDLYIDDGPKVTVTNGKIAGSVRVYGSAADEADHNSFTLAEDAVINPGTSETDYTGYGIILNQAYGTNSNSAAYGSTININGTVNGMVWVMGNIIGQGTNKPVINVAGSAVITGEDVGIAVNGAAVVNVSGGTITGKSSTGTGIEVRAGELNVSDGRITGEGAPTGTEGNGNGTTTSGAGIAIAQHTTKLPISVKVQGGTITGNTAVRQADPQGNDDAAHVAVELAGGTYIGTDADKTAVRIEQPETVRITGGVYSDNSGNDQAILPSGKALEPSVTYEGMYELRPSLLAFTAEAKESVYTGSPVPAEVTTRAKNEDVPLVITEGTDYEVQYLVDGVWTTTAPTDAGTYSAKLVGKENSDYAGTESKEFEYVIAPTDLSAFTVAAIEPQLYTGKPIEPALLVKATSETDDGDALIADTDYTATYEQNTNVGIAKVTVTGKGNYTGKIVTYFAINEADSSKVTMTINPDEFVYDGTAKIPTVTVTDTKGTEDDTSDDKVLNENTDYDLTIYNNTEAGTATVIAVLKGNYEGAVTGNFTIKAAVAKIDDKYYATVEEAIEAVEEGKTIELLVDNEAGGLEVADSKKFTLDLGGHTLDAYLDIYDADVTIANGKVAGTIYANGSATDAAYGHVTIAEDATVEADYAVVIYQANTDPGQGFGQTVDIYGTVNGMVWVMGNIKEMGSNPSIINVYEGASITGNDVGIALNGAAVVKVSGGTVTGISGTGTGIEVRAGKLNVTGGTIVGEGSPTEVSPNGNGTTSFGTGIAIAQHTTKLPVTVDVAGGTVKGATAVYQSDPEGNGDAAHVSVTLSNGTFLATSETGSAVYTADKNVVITGGAYSDDKEETKKAVSEGKTLIQGEDGLYRLADVVTVTFDAKEGTPVPDAQKIVKGGKANKPQDPVKEGAVFAGWMLDDEPYDFDTAVTEDIELAAAWTAAVAKIGDTCYASLQDAVDAAEGGDTIVMIADEELDAQVVITKDLTVDLNGHKLYNEDADFWEDTEDVDDWSLISVQGADVTITGNGMVQAKKDDTYAMDLRGGGKLTIENGTFLGNITSVYAYEGDLVINGGSFDIQQLSSQGDKRYEINCLDGNYVSGASTVTITGGTFTGFDPSDNLAEGTGTDFTPAGYTGKLVEGETDVWTVVEQTPVDKPAAQSFTYDGEEKTGVEEGEGYTLTGTAKETAVRDYTVTAALESELYIWSDMTEDDMELAWSITPADLAAAAIEPIDTQAYTGSTITPVPTVKIGDKLLDPDNDFDVSYKNNKNTGLATVTITGKGNYTGTAITYFAITDGLAHEHELTKTDAEAATCTETGNSAYWTCSECEKYFSDAKGTTEIEKDSWVIPAAGHKLTETKAKAATCLADGNSAYWTCSECGKYFSDAEGTAEINEGSWVIEKTGHAWGDWIELVKATCGQSGARYHICGNNPLHVEIEQIPASGEHKLTRVEAKEADCAEAGNSEYWTCSECGKCFSDAEGTTEIEKDSVVIPATGHDWEDWTVLVDPTCEKNGIKHRECRNNPLHQETGKIPATGHQLTKVAAKAATCMANGTGEYYKCSVCGKMYSDAEGKTAISAPPVINATGHNWGSPVWTWSKDYSTATVKFTCSKCKETRIETATVKKATTPAKPGVAGKNDYTGTVTLNGKTYTNKKTETIPALPTVVKATGIKLNKTSVTVPDYDQTVALTATVTPTNATNKKVTWKSSNTKVATVDANGKVTSKANGTAVITATTADGSNKSASCTVNVKKPSVAYRTHVQTYGWQNYVRDGAMSGTEGKAKRLEGINIKLENAPYSGSIVYRTHVQTYGWQAWKKDNQMSGTEGEAKRLEGIQIYLTGEMAKHYDVYYRVHAQTYGWLDWAKNGVMAGTSGLAKRLEGINIVLVPKGGKSPGGSARSSVCGNGTTLPPNPYKEP